jgi:hypothetical protein
MPRMPAPRPNLHRHCNNHNTSHDQAVGFLSGRYRFASHSESHRSRFKYRRGFRSECQCAGNRPLRRPLALWDCPDHISEYANAGQTNPIIHREDRPCPGQLAGGDTAAPDMRRRWRNQKTTNGVVLPRLANKQARKANKVSATGAAGIGGPQPERSSVA